MQIRPTQTITISDPREFEGDPYQVAARAIQQTRALTEILIENLQAVDLMARNSELERQLALGTPSDELRKLAAAWPKSPQGRKLADLHSALQAASDALPSLEKAVAYNPKAERATRRAR